MTYPPHDDRLRHLIAQEINPHVASWKLAFFIANGIVTSRAVRGELKRIAEAHAAAEHCGDRNCEHCWTASVTAAAPAAASPAPADRAALLRAADLVDERADDLWAPGTKANAEMHADAAKLRRMADEAPGPDRCSACRYVPCDNCRSGGEASGPWLVRKICCGRDDGEAEFASWAEADRFREAYVDSARIADHERSAIVQAAAGRTDDEPAAGLPAGGTPQNGARKACSCGQGGCEYCDVDDDADEEQQPAPMLWMGATELAPDRVITALAATGLIGYRQNSGRLLHCLAHKPAPASRYADFREVTAGDLDDGGICVHPDCGRDLLAPWPAAVSQPGKEA